MKYLITFILMMILSLPLYLNFGEIAQTFQTSQEMTREGRFKKGTLSRSHEEGARFELTPLQTAITEENIDAVKSFLKYGVDIEQRVQVPCYIQNRRVKSFYQNVEGYTPLHLAILVGEPSVVKLLLEYGADMETRITPHGSTSLIYAAELGDVAILEMLIAAGADTSAVTGGIYCWEKADMGFSALDMALRHGNSECIEALN